jgi:hypothetical protein
MERQINFREVGTDELAPFSGPIRDVINQFKYQAENPPANDMVIGAFAGAMAERIEYNPLVQSLYKDIISTTAQTRGAVPIPTELTNKSLRAIQVLMFLYPEYLTNNNTLNYPNDFTTKQVWKSTINKVFDSNNEDLSQPLGEFKYLMTSQALMSNVDKRSRPLIPVLQLAKERFNEPPRVLEFGCSRNHILEVMHRQIKMGGVIIQSAEGEEDSATTNYINDLLDYQPGIGTSHGVDIWPLRDPRIKSWAKSCSFYPSELNDPELIKRYDEIDDETKQVTGFIHGSATNIDDYMRPLLIPERYHVTFMSTMLYQNNIRDIKKIIKNAVSLTHDSGFVVVQDFAVNESEITTRDSIGPVHGIRFPKYWFGKIRFPYRTFVLDKSKVDEGFQEIARWQSSRCEVGILGKKTLELLGATA